MAGVIFPDVPEKLDIVGRMSIHRTVRKNISYICVCGLVWFDFARFGLVWSVFGLIWSVSFWFGMLCCLV